MVVKKIRKINLKLIAFLKKCSPPIVILFLTIYFLVGRLIACDNYFEYSLIHQINLSIVLFLEVYILRKFYLSLDSLKKVLAGKNTPVYALIKRMQKTQESILFLLIPFALASIFAFTIVYMKYIPLNIMGFYGGGFATICFFFALLAYYNFVMAIIFIKKCSNLPLKLLPFNYPKDIVSFPDWLAILVKIYNMVRYIVPTIGTLYTLEYVLLVPRDSIQLQPNFEILVDYPFIFLYNWIIIFALIVIACPILLHMLDNYLKKLVKNTCSVAMTKIDKIYLTIPSSLETINIYQQIIDRLKSSQMYKIETRYMYPTIATMVSLILNIIKIFEVYLIPWLGSPI